MKTLNWTKQIIFCAGALAFQWVIPSQAALLPHIEQGPNGFSVETVEVGAGGEVQAVETVSNGDYTGQITNAGISASGNSQPSFFSSPAYSCTATTCWGTISATDPDGDPLTYFWIPEYPAQITSITAWPAYGSVLSFNHSAPSGGSIPLRVCVTDNRSDAVCSGGFYGWDIP